MGFGLGIDTGGTYTDAAIYDFENDKVIAAAKSITVKEDLTIGINGALEQLPYGLLEDIKLVSLSTTLATNACVEGKGSRARLVLIGCDEQIAARLGHKYGLPRTEEIIFLEGGHDQQGKVVCEPDWDYLKRRALEYKEQTDAFAVVELWGIRNAEFEKRAKDVIADCTGLQAVCGHELTGEINSLKRAASALLNAQLIPIINSFLNAVKASMKQKGIKAPLVIVRGDGSLMSEEFTRSKPVETLLCGPAASVAGGINLTNEKNSIIVDMGGTTSDISVVKDGIPVLADEGAIVGKWRTGIKSVLINTIGLGGDSLIRHINNSSLAIGPVRAAPLSWTASRWPSVLEKIRELYENRKPHTVSLCEFFYLVRDITSESFYTGEEHKICGALKEGPLSLSELALAADTSIYELNVKRLEQYGVIMRCGLTPTDLMHLSGEFNLWNKEAARLGAAIMAFQTSMDMDELAQTVTESMKETLYMNIVGMLLEDENESFMSQGSTKQLDELIAASFRKRRRAGADVGDTGSFIDYSFSTDAALVGIGAPVHIFLPDVAAALGARCVIPENAGVANAIGAITGNVLVEESITIKPQYATQGITGYIVFTPMDNRKFDKLPDAVEWARTAIYDMALKSASDRGAGDVHVTVYVNHNEAEITLPGPAVPDDGAKKAGPGQKSGKRNKVHLDTVVTARAAGKVNWF